jgi:hypothetical protein
MNLDFSRRKHSSPIQFWVGLFVLDGVGWLDFETALNCSPNFFRVEEGETAQLYMPEVAALLPLTEGPK